jgi:hypothetical protein
LLSVLAGFEHLRGLEDLRTLDVDDTKVRATHRTVPLCKIRR